MIGPTPPIYRSILVSLQLPSAAANRFGFIADFPDPYSSAKLFMSLLSKARDFLPGLISFTSVNVRRENLITARSVPWLSSGYASFSPARRPTSPTMNPSISTPSQTKFFPLGIAWSATRLQTRQAAREQNPLPAVKDLLANKITLFI